MKTSSIHQNQLIERYLRQELTSEELSIFTTQLVLDKELRQKVEQMRLMTKTLQTTSIPPDTTPFQSKNWLLWSALILVSLCLVGYISYQVLSKKQPPTTEPKSMPPIAANFALNSYLETFLHSHRSSSGLSLIQPQDSVLRFSLNKKEKIELDLEGILGTENEHPLMVLTIFTNKEEDFEANRSLLDKQIVLERRTESEWGFKVLETLNWGQGLYYYIFKDGENGALLKVGKIIITD